MKPETKKIEKLKSPLWRNLLILLVVANPLIAGTPPSTSFLLTLLNCSSVNDEGLSIKLRDNVLKVSSDKLLEAAGDYPLAKLRYTLFGPILLQLHSRHRTATIHGEAVDRKPLNGSRSTGR